MTGPPEDPAQRPGASLWLAALVGGLVLYVLSIGPAAALVSNRAALTILPKVYAPVIWLHDHTFLEKPLEWYVGLFGRQ